MMMNNVMNTVRMLAVELLPTLIFVVVQHFWGLKLGIVAALLITVIAVMIMIIRQIRPSALFIFSIVFIIVSSVIDLTSHNPFLFKYEPVVSNMIFGIFFFQSCFWGTPLITELASKIMPIEGRGTLAYLRGLTMVWALQFMLKAGLYFGVIQYFSLEETLFIRLVIGKGFFLGLLFGERIFRKHIYRLCVSWNILPTNE